MLVGYALLVIAVLFAVLMRSNAVLTTSDAADNHSSSTSLDTDLRDLRAKEAFSALLNKSADPRSSGSKVERRREIQRTLLGPLTPVDCNTQERLCVQPENCRLFCKDASVMPFDCVNGRCVESVQTNDATTNTAAGAGNESNCDTKNGEFGLLVGYNDIGVAQWECVQLYPGWEERGRYCENGEVTLDTRVRTPSYTDCQCPAETIRMVYEKSVLGQTVYGLPHCVPNHLVNFYSLSYRMM